MRSGYIKPTAYSTAPRSQRPGLWLSLRTWWEGMDLDTKLADGVDPTQSRELSLRAQQLANPKARAELARRVSRLVELADRSFEPTITTRTPFQRGRVRACRQWLIQIVERLRDDRQLAAQGLAMTALLLEDGRGPLYADGPPEAFEKAVRSILVALDTAETFPNHLRSGVAALDAARE